MTIERKASFFFFHLFQEKKNKKIMTGLMERKKYTEI